MTINTGRLVAVYRRAALVLIIGLLALPGMPSIYASEDNLPPSLELTDPQDQIHSLAQYRGQVVLINFWATWCPPCLKEMPMLNELHTTYKDQGVVVLGLSLDEEGLSITAPFIEKLGIAYPIVESDKKTYQAYGNILTIPHTFVVDRNGLVTKRFVNNQSKEAFEAAIKAAL